MRSILLATVFAIALVSPAQAGTALSAPMHRTPAINLRVPLVPFAWIGSGVRKLFGHRHDLANATALSRDQGWMSLELPVNEPASALFLEVAGRVQFDSAEIVFRDGVSRPIDLRGVVRGRGLFELHDCAGEPEVVTVRLNVRAATSRARVGVRIARF